jgi:hypothetical protein
MLTLTKGWLAENRKENLRSECLARMYLNQNSHLESLYKWKWCANFYKFPSEIKDRIMQHMFSSLVKESCIIQKELLKCANARDQAKCVCQERFVEPFHFKSGILLRMTELLIHSLLNSKIQYGNYCFALEQKSLLPFWWKIFEVMQKNETTEISISYCK